MIHPLALKGSISVSDMSLRGDRKPNLESPICCSILVADLRPEGRLQGTGAAGCGRCVTTVATAAATWVSQHTWRCRRSPEATRESGAKPGTDDEGREGQGRKPRKVGGGGGDGGRNGLQGGGTGKTHLKFFSLHPPRVTGAG